MVSPAYFAGVVQLGGLMQTANAFGQVQEALSVFVNVYRQLAEWRAVTVQRNEELAKRIREGGVDEPGPRAVIVAHLRAVMRDPSVQEP